jgi:signal transduction histidine kinase
MKMARDGENKVHPSLQPPRQSSPPKMSIPFAEKAQKDPEPSEKPKVFHPETEIFYNLLWLIRLRWVAIFGILASLFIAYQTSWIQNIARPLLGVGALLAFNSWSHLHWSSKRAKHSPKKQPIHKKKLFKTIFIQLEFDLAALTFLIHSTGGIENPVVMMYVFPVALAAILLPWKEAMFVYGSAVILYATLIIGEFVEGKLHRPFPSLLDELSRGDQKYILLNNPIYIFALAAAMGLTLLGIVYFLQESERARRRSERKRLQHELVAKSRERMARVGTLAAGLVHSIRNPLHGTLNCVDLLSDHIQNSEGEETLDLLKEGLTRIEHVTSSLLALTRESPVTKRVENLNACVLETLRFFELRSQNSIVSIHKNLDLSLPKIPLDPDRFHEALFNILANAHDALIEGSGNIYISTKKTKDPFEGVAVEIRDDGEGIEEKDLDKIFDPFFTTKPIGEGTGLGLGITRRIIEEHGGDLQVKSKRREGTKMKIILPLEEDENLMEIREND